MKNTGSMKLGEREVVVITGASAGVGRATARAFARSGARIGLIARGRDGLEGTLRDVEELGGEGFIVQADVARNVEIEQAAAQIEKHFGPIDIWINNAMVSVFSPVKLLEAEEIARVTEVTYLGCVYGTMAALRRMLPRNHGTIVQVGSALAYRGIPLQSAYCGAKHAIQGFTEALRTELLHDKSRVRVSIVELAAMNTPQFSWVKSRMPRKPQPVPPIYQPEIAARAICYAAHNGRRQIDVGASTVIGVALNKVFPGLIDHYLARTGYSSQQTPEPADPNRPNNLWEPVAGDHGAHGSFGARATNFSEQVWATTHRSWLSGIALGLAAATSVFVLRKRHLDRVRNQEHIGQACHRFENAARVGAP
ncbi:MAG: SDR family oxidoreductase [Acidiferrobacteraceae bacterium]